MERFAQKILKNRWIIILSVIGITVFFGLQTRFLKINSDIISSLPDDDPAALMFKNIGNQFGGNEMGMIVLESDNIFKADLLQHVKQITDSLKITHGVSTVTSLTNILDIKSTEEGIEIGKLVDEYNLPFEQSRLDSLKTYIYSKEMYKYY
jgi:predicted RND superfamily exporter protein